MSTDSVDVSLGAFAKMYAREGFQVLPLVEAGKHPDGLLVPHAFKQATSDLSQIEQWWQKSPHANIGIRCGRQTGIFVLDIDPRNGGKRTFDRLIKKHGELPPTLMARTGGGGWHYFFKYESGLSSTLGPGIDVKKDGYVVAAPSLHPSGGHYLLSSLETPIADAPAWVVEESKRAREQLRTTKKSKTPDTISEGGRNDYLTSYAGRLRRDGATQDELEAALLIRNREYCQPPLPEEEVRTIARSVASYEPAKDTEALSTYTDYHNARRLFDAYRTRLRYIDGIGWYVWDGQRWALDKSRRHHAFAQRAALSIKDEIHAGMDADARKALLRWAAQSQDSRRINGMISEARPMFAARAERFDQQPMLLNVLNGTVDLATGELREHKRQDLLTQLAPVEYNPAAKAPRWRRFMREILPDVDTRAVVQRALGYSLTGDTREQVVFIPWGSGSNGKSTLLTAIREILGDYFQEAPPGFVKVKRFDGHPAELMLVKTRRVVAVIEQSERTQLNVELLKLLTGGEQVTARHMYREFEQFKMTAKVWLRYNEKPVIRETDYATWRRVRLIPFTQTFSGKSKDPYLDAKLREEYSGILNWLIEGCIAWQREGLGDAPEIEEATENYRRESDLLALFIEECCEEDPQAWTPSHTLWSAWEAWCKSSGLHPGNALSFSKALSSSGYSPTRERHHGKQERGVAGLRVKKIHVR
jgi:putative DNA primase/helicase